MKIKKLSGLIAASHTPFKKDGSLNLDMVQKQAELTIKQGVKGVYICGSTGEGISCSVAERKAVMAEWVKVAKGKLTIIAHIGALALPDAQDLSKYAQKVGCDATSIVPPNFFRPGSVDLLADFCQEIVKFSPDLPFYYYHTMMSGVNLPMVKFLEVADKKIPNMAGIKFNCQDLYEYQNCMNALDGKYDITFGVDEFFAGAITLGAKSAIGSTYNYMAPVYLKMMKDIKAGKDKEVQAAMKKVCQVVDILVQYGGIATGKAMMQCHGLDLGAARLPIRALTKDEIKDVLKRMEKLEVITR